MLFEPFDEMSWHTKVLSISVLEYFVVSCLQPSLYVDKGLWVTFKVFFTENMKRKFDVTIEAEFFVWSSFEIYLFRNLRAGFIAPAITLLCMILGHFLQGLFWELGVLQSL